MGTVPALRRRRHLAAACALTFLVAMIPALAASSRDAAAAGPETWTFNYTGGVQNFTVPVGVTQLTMIVFGASGGPAGTFAANPGTSGAIVGSVDVTPGQVLTVWVAGAGETGGQGGSSPGNGGWGFGCGGRGGQADNFLAYNGNGGGGASAVTTQYFVPDGACGTRPTGDAVFAVAGGSGGGGGDVVVPPGSGVGAQIALGGLGGNGGPSPTSGGGGSDGTANGGCGGCAGSVNGTQGSDNPGEGAGAGGGGGGSDAGDGGDGALGFFGGGGGGGGSTSAGLLLGDVGYLAGSGGGNGTVTLTAGSIEIVQCSGGSVDLAAPAGSGWMTVIAQGAHGATRGEGKGAPGAPGGIVGATVDVEGGDDVNVFTGCTGGGRGGGAGWSGGGNGGDAPDPWPYDGAGGGGASGVSVNGTPVVVAGAGGGGGGQGGAFGDDGGGNPGGMGGTGGIAPTAGAKGEEDDYAGGNGGCGGCASGPNGGGGGSSGRASEGGGGAGGGGGWYGGAGGQEGRLDITLVGGGGGGGGGGLSHVIASATDVTNGTSALGGNGLVELLFTPDIPTVISAYGGSSQQVTIGSAFAEPLAALVSDSTGRPVDGVSVLFTLPGSGASGTFAGGGTSQSVTTGSNGVATTAPITANLTAGGWQATASVTGITNPAVFVLRNSPSATSTTVLASSDPATPTEDVTFTATVTAATAAAGTPVGDVQFIVDAITLGGPVALDGAGVAVSPVISGLSPGDHNVVARFFGTDDYLASNGALTLPVVLTPTATAVSSSINPSIETEAVTFTATISVPTGNTAYSGTVQFQIDGVDFGAPVAAVGGTATSGSIDTLLIADSPYVITALTAQTAQYAASTGSMHQVVDPDGTAVTVSSSANPVQYGVPIDLDALVVPRPGGSLVPTGTVSFTVGGNPGCTGTLAPVAPNADTSCTLPSPPMPLAPDSYDIVGSYSGDPDFDPSVGSMVQQVLRARTTTTVTGTPAGGSLYGQDVTFTADIARVVAGSGTPTGTVQFAIDGTPLGGPVSVSGGQATSSSLTPDVGGYAVTAVYSGDTNFSGSTGATSYQVEPAPTAVALTALPEPSHEHEPVSFVADVAAQVPGATPVPTGAIQFRVDGIAYGDPVTLVDGRAVSPTRDDLDHGIHHIAATYVPDTDNFAPSHTFVEHDVREDSATVVASSENPAPVGAPITLRAHVGPKTGEGTMSFTIDGVPVAECQAVPVVESEAACAVSGLAPGAHEVLAVYSGAPTLDPSEGVLLQLVVGGPNPTFTG